MKKAILGKKLGMTQIFSANGLVVPVTVVEAGPCSVVQKKTVENDGYSAVQLGFGDKKEKNVNKPMKGHFAKAGVSVKRYLREFKFDNADEMNVGDEIKVDMFEAGIIDPTKVSRVALENAASVAGMFLTTECAIVDLPEPAAPAMPAGAGMGGMM